jgi:multidrug efflux pump subunit AcrB
VNLVAAVRSRASLVVVVTVAALAWGVASLFGLPSGIYPDVDFPRIVVVARVGDLPPEVVVTDAARPIEEAVASIPGVKRVRSRTIRGAAELSVEFVAGSDMWRALQAVQTAVEDVRDELPADTELRVERVTPTALPIVTFNVQGPVDPRVLRETAELVVRPALLQVPGMGTVEVQGGDVREFEVILDPVALAATHLTPSQVADRLGAAELVVAVGRAFGEHQVMTVLVASERSTPVDIAALPIAEGPSSPVQLSSVAQVVEGVEDRTLMVAGPRGDGVVVTVSRSPGASAPDVVAGARAAIARLEAAHALPPAVGVETVYDQSVLIRDALAGVRDAILLGIALSLVVLAAFLRDWRAGTAAAVAVPITLVCTLGVMRLLGQTLNLMSLGGLAVAIGLVVDDAIVIVEAIVQRLEAGDAVGDAVERGTGDLLAAVVGTTVTTVVVFAPLALISGVVGTFFGALAVTLCSAVSLSLLVSLTIVPLVAARVLRRRGGGGAGSHGPGGRLGAAYGRLVRRVASRPVPSVIGVVLVAAAGVLAATRVPTGFLPSMDEGAMVVDFFLPPGTSIEETSRVASRLDAILRSLPDVRSFTRRTGAEMGPATATLQNSGDILVRLAPRGERDSVYDVMDQVRVRAEREAPEARVEFVQVLQDVLDDLSGNPRPIEVRIFGPDQRVLTELATKAAARISDIPDLEDFFDGVEGDVPTLRADVDPLAAARLGATPEAISRELEASLAGKVVAQVRVRDRRLGVRVRLPDAVRFDPGAIAALPLAFGDRIVPLSAVAKLSRPVGPSVLLRESLSPVVKLTSGLRLGADLGGVTREVRRRLGGLALPSGYRLDVGGQGETAAQTQRELATTLGLGIALVLAVLLIQLRSLRLALVALLGAPLALVGAVVTLLATGIPLNASSLMGCVLLAGLVVKNSILLLEHAQHLAPEAGSFREAVARAGQRRLRPILITTAATMAGLLPLALGVGAGSELQRPLAVATIGGLALSTLVTLFALPALACALFSGRRA